MISLLHGTTRPERWHEICQAWYDTCDYPKNVEYVLVYDKFPYDFNIDMPFENKTILANYGRACVVDAYNKAADSSMGEFLFYIADDFWPRPHWDTILDGLLTKSPMSNEAVYWVGTGEGANAINHPLFTRAYFNRYGYYLWPEYLDLFSDTEFDSVARRDGVIVDIRDRIHFDHRQAGLATAKYAHDEVNLTMLSRWHIQEELYLRRKAANFPVYAKNGLKPLGAGTPYIPKGMQ